MLGYFVAVEKAKEKWKSLRDEYVRQKKKQKAFQTSGSARMERVKWPVMVFIQPCPSWISLFNQEGPFKYFVLDGSGIFCQQSLNGKALNV